MEATKARSYWKSALADVLRFSHVGSTGPCHARDASLRRARSRQKAQCRCNWHMFCLGVVGLQDFYHKYHAGTLGLCLVSLAPQVASSFGTVRAPSLRSWETVA